MADTIHYPASVYDHTSHLLSALGSWWANDYVNAAQVESLVAAKCEQERQTLQDVEYIVNSLGRETVPLYHVDNWHAFRFRAGDRQFPQVRYDESHTYSGELRYNEQRQTEEYIYPIPPHITHVPAVFNRLTEPSLAWSHGIDYEIREGVIVFYADPFQSPLIAKRRIVADNEQQDVEAVLWFYRSEADWQTAYTHFGRAVNLFARTSRGYKELLNAVWDCLVSDCSVAALHRGLIAITGIPLVREPVEQVTHVSHTATVLQIHTNAHIYNFPADVCPIVTAGQIVKAGDPLTDALLLYESNGETIPAWLQAMAIGEGFIPSCYLSDLVFEDKQVPVQVSQGSDGFVKVTWPLGGFHRDVSRFFDEIHRRGVLACQQDPTGTGQTLAHKLAGGWTDADNEPQAADLPRMINPLRFLFTNLFRGNITVAKVRHWNNSATNVGWQFASVLHRLVPADTALLLLVDLPQQQDTITEDHVTDSGDLFHLSSATLLEVEDSYVHEIVSVRSVSV